MPNMDGTGPLFASERNGRGLRRRFGNIGGATTHRFGRGIGFCRFPDKDDKESLIASRASLQRRIKHVGWLAERTHRSEHR